MPAREFAEKEFPQVAQECDEHEKMDMALLKKARELGFVGTHLPEEYGRFGMSYFEEALITEEFWRVDPGVAHSILSITFGSEIIVEHGTDAQKKKFLPHLIQGDGIIAGAIYIHKEKVQPIIRILSIRFQNRNLFAC
jgi:alkylation response protein AidB-like acyl-CoA dehydrogenase